tara:strand:- start:202 stop:519 length:318 start_codon:yes stop_codon:yes gene_type:complete
MNSLKTNTKGAATLSGLQGIIWTLVMIGIMLVVGLTVMDQLQDTVVDGTAGCNSTDTSSCGAAFDASNATISAIADIPDWLPVIVVVVVASVVLGLVYFFRRTGE